MKNAIHMAEIKLTEAEVEAACGILRSGALRQGKKCEEFEGRFAEMVGAGTALTCSSGTAALHLAFMAYLQPGDEVLVPSFTFIATASMASMMGACPVFCDIDLETWTIDVQDARQKITAKTKAIVPVHIFGNVCPVDEIQNLAAEHDLYVIWDAAQAHGARYDDLDVGGLEDCVCYSFYPSKNMFTGEGGLISLKDSEKAEKIRHLRSHGQTGKYYHTMLGFNYRMTDVEAAVGLEQLKRLADMIALRRRNATIMTEGLAEVSGITSQGIYEKSKHAYHQYSILVEPDLFGMDRDALAAALQDRGIGTGVHYPRGLHQQPVYEEIYGRIQLPVCEQVCNKILALPIHHGLESGQVEQIVSAIKDIRDIRPSLKG